MIISETKFEEGLARGVGYNQYRLKLEMVRADNRDVWGKADPMVLRIKERQYTSFL